MKGIRFRRGAAVATLAIGLAVAFGAAGCATKARPSNATAEGQGEPAKGAPGQAGDTPLTKPGAPGLPAQPAPGDVADQRVVIYTGTITVRVSNVEEKAAAATALATGAGGLIGGDQRTSDDGRSRAQLVLRVPSARFGAIVDGVAKLGKEQSRQLSTEDVTAKAVDLEARIATAQASVDRVRALLAKAQSVGEIVSIESELTRREADLESLKAQKNKLDDLSALSTITAILLGPEAAVTDPKAQTGFLAGLRSGWRAFVTSLQVLLTVVGALLPWLIALGIPVVIVVWFARRLQRRSAGARREAFPVLAPAAGPPFAAPPAAEPTAAPPAAEPPAGRSRPTPPAPLGEQLPSDPPPPSVD